MGRYGFKDWCIPNEQAKRRLISQKKPKQRKEEESSGFLHFFPAVKELKHIVAAVSLKELAGFLVGNGFFLELADVVSLFCKEYYAIHASSSNAINAALYPSPVALLT